MSTDCEYITPEKMKSTPKPRDHHHENFDRIERLDRKLADLGIKNRKDEDSQNVTGEDLEETTDLPPHKLANKHTINSRRGSVSTRRDAHLFGH